MSVVTLALVAAVSAAFVATNPALAAPAAAAGGIATDALVIEAVAPCPESRDVTWLLINPNDDTVDVALSLEADTSGWSRTLTAAPGVTPIVVTVALFPSPVLVASWVDQTAATVVIRSPAPAPLAAGVPAHTSRCCGGPNELWFDLTATPGNGEAVTPGSTVSWVVSVVSTGTVPRVSTDVVEVVPSWVRVTDAGGGQLAADGRRITWQVDLLPGQRRDLRYEGLVSDAAPVGVELTNSAVAASAGLFDTTVHPVTATVSAGSATGPTPTATVPTATSTAPTATVPTAVTTLGETDGSPPVLMAGGLLLVAASVAIARRRPEDR